MDAYNTDTRTIPELVSTLTSDLANLVRKEGELVRTEVTEKISHTGKAVAQIAIGGVLLLGAFMVLLQALVVALSKVMDPLWASLIVGLLVGLAGWLVVQAAVKMMKPAALAPDRTVRQMQKDRELLKEQVAK